MGLCGDGAMAEWLGSGLQIHVRRFDSGSHLHNLLSKRDLTNPVYVYIMGMLTAARIKEVYHESIYGSCSLRITGGKRASYTIY